MLSDKELKSKYKPNFWADPDKYYATETLKNEGFHRKTCVDCKKPFWSSTDRQLCGDPSCSQEESFGFIGKTPVKEPISYIDVWKKFEKMFQGFGYSSIKRYPVVARWNPTMEYTIASIAAFQPYVISGESPPPSKQLVIPQFCLRFGDIDNVGITGSHHTGFVMIGQHQFLPPDEWNQQDAFVHLQQWFKKGLGLPNNEMVFHEDAWAGGGNLGCCMEFFSRGCELANQVYMMYEQTPEGKIEELKLKVLDMGMGMERNAWFSQGTNTIYDAVFPDVLRKLRSAAGMKQDKELWKRFVPHAGKLNIDEAEDINRAWKDVADQLHLKVEELRSAILPHAAMYSIGEHARSLLFAISDGGLPSNVGGGYNLRVILRRALGFIEHYGWNINFSDVCAWHAEELKKLFPELSENIENVQKIIDVEKNKYRASRQKARQAVTNLLESNEKIDEKTLLELYDSQGIDPELVEEEAKKENKNVKIPDNFYGKVAELHEKKSQAFAVKEALPINLQDVKKTRASYFEDWKKMKFRAKIEKSEGQYVVLDATYFYPTSGGQMHDIGTIQGEEVVDIIKQGQFIVHKLKTAHKFEEGEEVECEIDWDRRLQLAQHHTATHLVGAAACEVLGPHINQAGAKKTAKRAHLDVTHYENISEKDIEAIEARANELIGKAIPLHKKFYKRNEAEKTYGTRIYQGGAVPGSTIRIVEIPEVDVQACGGTHVDNTSEISMIKILKSSKISDGVVRIFFTAGNAAQDEEQKEGILMERTAHILGCSPEQVPKRAEELFVKWKKARKAARKGENIRKEDIVLKSTETSEGDLIAQAAQALNTQEEYVPRTCERFLRELKELL